MGLASALGQTFNMPQERKLQGSQAQAQQQQQAGGSILGAPPTGLENVDQTTQAFYDKWGELESFASDMKLQYGIDVTRPDFSTSEGMEAHKMYQKALADLRYQGNALKNSQAALSKYQTAQTGAQGDRVSYDGQTGEQMFDSNRVNMAAKPVKETQGRETWAEWKRKKDYEAGIKSKETEAKKKKSEAEYSFYKDKAEQVANLGAGKMEFSYDEDTETFTSDVLEGTYFGGRNERDKVTGVERRDGKAFIQYGVTDEGNGYKDEIEIREDNLPAIYEKLIQGSKGSTGLTVAAEFLKFSKDQGIENVFAVEGDDGSGWEAADKQIADYAEGKTQEIKDGISSALTTAYTKDNKTLLNTNLKGKTLEIKEDDGAYTQKVVKKVESSNYSGEYKITFENGDVLRVGKSNPKNNYAIEDFLNGTKVEDINVEESTPKPTDMYTMNGKDYSYEQLKGAKTSDGKPWTDEMIKTHAKKK